MSLLDTSTAYEPIKVFLEEMVYDSDGNPRTRPSATGIDATARFQIQGQSGTSARRSEQDNEGYESEKVYTMRFPRSFPYTLGAQSEIEWGTRSDGRPQRWVIFGDENKYNASRRTRRSLYTIKRVLMAQLFGKKVVHSIVAHEVRDDVHDEAKEVGRRASAYLAEARASTHWHKILGPGHLTSVSVSQGEVDSFVNLDAPNPMAIEFGHEPSGYFAGTNTRAPHGLYILTHATGLTDLSS